MRATVLRDPRLAKQAGRFVWLSIDAENAANAGFLDKFPIDSYPSFFVIDPNGEKPLMKWLGSATVGQLEELLASGERAFREQSGTGAQAELAKADGLMGESRYAEAAEAYGRALGAGGAKWEERPRAAQAYLLALQSAHASERCATEAARLGPELPRGTAFANVVASGLYCVLDEPRAAWALQAEASLVPLAREAVKLPGLLGDDRSGVYEALVLATEDRDPAAGKALAHEWFDFLAGEQKKAKDADTRSAYDPHLVEAAIEMGDPAAAIPALQHSERDLPSDYNPPARLALVYRELGRYRDALAASDRALARVYGPRKVRVLSDRAKIFEVTGEAKEARSTLEDALAFARTLPKEQRPEGLVKSIEQKLANAK